MRNIFGKKKWSASSYLLIVAIIMFSVGWMFIFYTLLNNPASDLHTNEQKTGDFISVSVDSPFLFSLVSDLVQGSNTSVSLEDSPSSSIFNYQLYNNENEPFFEEAKKNVILYGENFLHNINLMDYDKREVNVPSLPIGYNSRKDNISSVNYFQNPQNGLVILNSIYNDIEKHSSVFSSNKDRIEQEVQSLFLKAQQLGSDFSDPVIFYAGETNNLGWFQSLNKKIKIISLTDSKTKNLAETYELFKTALKKVDSDKVLVDKNIDEDVISLLKKDFPDINVIYMDGNDITNKFSDLYQKNISRIEEAIVNTR